MTSLTILPTSKVVGTELLFHGQVRADNISPTVKSGYVFCASSMPLGDVGVAGVFNIHARYRDDMYTEVVDGGGRAIDADIHDAYSITHYREIQVIQSAGYRFMLKGRKPLRYDEVLCSVPEGTEIVRWYNDLLGVAPVEGHVPVSTLIHQIVGSSEYLTSKVYK